MAWNNRKQLSKSVVVPKRNPRNLPLEICLLGVSGWLLWGITDNFPLFLLWMGPFNGQGEPIQGADQVIDLLALAPHSQRGDTPLNASSIAQLMVADGQRTEWWKMEGGFGKSTSRKVQARSPLKEFQEGRQGAGMARKRTDSEKDRQVPRGWYQRLPGRSQHLALGNLPSP